ncbi:MAG: hypothetical protein R2796_00955 [Chitinophagaceae bacterium]
MNIDRHNYEEFFILYMDNELSSEERCMVEDFVGKHPDLQEELLLLQQFKLQPDESITYHHKEELLKGNAIIHAANIEEWLLLYIDNELNTDQQQLVEAYLADHPAAEKEWLILQKCKAAPDTIVFADKKSLYKNTRTIRTLPKWWRAVAAVLLVLLVSATVFIVRHKKTIQPNEQFVETTKPTIEQLKNPAVQQPATESVADNNRAKENETLTEKKTTEPQFVSTQEKEKKQNPVDRKDVLPDNKIVQPVTTPLQNQHNALAVNKTNNLPIPTLNPNVLNTIQGDYKNPDVATINPIKIESPTLTNTKVTQSNRQPSDYTTASYVENENNNGSSSKLRGFFRKLTRVLEKRTNIKATNDDGKLLIAGLAIKVK